jgi:hypothetical protein
MTFLEYLTYLLIRLILYITQLLSEMDENIRIISINDIISFVNYLL